MSLETEISKLTQAVIALTERLSVLEGKAEQKTEHKQETKQETKPEAKAEPKAETKPEPKVEAQEPVDRQSIVDLCMSIVKADRSKGKAIKEVFASFDGAKVVGDVQDKDLASLKAKIEGLQ